MPDWKTSDQPVRGAALGHHPTAVQIEDHRLDALRTRIDANKEGHGMN
jgi:hypothetical protein